MKKVDGIILTPIGMAILEKEKAGVIADLHIGMEELALITSRLQTSEMLSRVEEYIEAYSLEKIVIAGDIKHSFSKETSQEWEETRLFFSRLSKKVEVIILKGNHDFFIKNMLRGHEISDTYRIGNYVITHGHLNVLRGEGEVLIIGNEHPSLTLKDEVGAKVRARCYVFHEAAKILILPAFNPLTKGSDVRGLTESVMSPALKHVNMLEARVFVINDGEVLDFGTIRDIKELL